MGRPVRVNSQSLRLSNIMEQHAKPQHLVRLHAEHGVQNMFPHIVAVMLMSLRGFHAEVKFRQNLRCDTKLVSGPQIIGMGRSHQFHKLHLNPFRADFL